MLSVHLAWVKLLQELAQRAHLSLIDQRPDIGGSESGRIAIIAAKLEVAGRLKHVELLGGIIDSCPTMK